MILPTLCTNASKPRSVAAAKTVGRYPSATSTVSCRSEVHRRQNHRKPLTSASDATIPSNLQELAEGVTIAFNELVTENVTELCLTEPNIGCPTVHDRVIGKEASFGVVFSGQDPESLQSAQSWHEIDRCWVIVRFGDSDAGSVCPGLLRCDLLRDMQKTVDWRPSDYTEQCSGLDRSKEMNIKGDDIDIATLFGDWDNLDDGHQVGVCDVDLTYLLSPILAKAVSVDDIESQRRACQRWRYTDFV
jgi:hypothetical protein